MRTLALLFILSLTLPTNARAMVALCPQLLLGPGSENTNSEISIYANKNPQVAEILQSRLKVLYREKGAAVAEESKVRTAAEERAHEKEQQRISKFIQTMSELVSALGINGKLVQTPNLEESYIELLPGNPADHFLNGFIEKYISDPKYRTAAFPQGVRTRIIIAGDFRQGEFNFLTGVAGIVAANFIDPAMVRATLVHEDVHASKYCEWMNLPDGQKPSAINISVNGDLPGLPADHPYAKKIIAQEMPAFEDGARAYVEDSKKNGAKFSPMDAFMQERRESILHFFQILTSEVLDLLLEIDSEEFIAYSHEGTFKKVDQKTGLGIEISASGYEFLKRKNVYAAVIITKKISENKTRKYTLRVPIVIGTDQIDQTIFLSRLQQSIGGLEGLTEKHFKRLQGLAPEQQRPPL